MGNEAKFPKHIHVLGVKFRVELVEEVDDTESLGSTHGETRMIRISSALDSRRRWTTLWHEVVHACFHVIGFGNESDSMLEEILVQSLEHTLEQFMLQHGPEYLASLEGMK